MEQKDQSKQYITRSDTTDQGLQHGLPLIWQSQNFENLKTEVQLFKKVAITKYPTSRPKQIFCGF